MNSKINKSNPIDQKLKPIFNIFLFIILSVTSSLLFSYQNISLSKKSIISKAQTTNECTEPTGTEKYINTILPVGAHLAANNNPKNYKQIRQLYNCKNKDSKEVKEMYIPVTIVYDMNFLKGSKEGIINNLQELKKYGLFPVIRVASYMGKPEGCINDCWIKLYTAAPKINDDIQIMATNLSDALNSVKDIFPTKPIVVFFNEVNLDLEWQGKTNPQEFGKAISDFVNTMKNGYFKIYFPALSYGAREDIGISPATYLSDFAPNFKPEKSEYKFDGVDLNIYGTSYQDIKSQYVQQLGAFDNYKDLFKGVIENSLGEMGPVANGSIIYDCSENGPWSEVATQIISEYIKDPITIATTACFGNTTYPGIANYINENSPLISLSQYGQITNNADTKTTTQTNTNQQQNNQQQTTNTQTTKDGFSYEIKDPDLYVTFTTKQGLTFINLAGTGPNEKINMANITPLMGKSNAGFYWTYIVRAVKEGNYSFTFSDRCDKYNKKTVKKEELKDVCDSKGTGSVTIQKNTKGELSIKGDNVTNTNNNTNNNQTNIQSNTNTQNNQQTNNQKTTTTNSTNNTQGGVKFLLNTQNKTIVFVIDELKQIGICELNNIEYCSCNKTSGACCNKPSKLEIIKDKDTGVDRYVAVPYESGKTTSFQASVPSNCRDKSQGSDRVMLPFEKPLP